MKLKRILSLVLVAILALVLVACGGGKNKDEDLLKSYLLDLGNVIDKDFTVDAALTVGDKSYELTWTSSDECLKVADKAVDGSYTVTVTRPEEKKDVTLTVKLGKATKDFTFQVNPYTVYDFTGAFVFEFDKATVAQDFDLPTSFEKWGKTATIAWESLNTDLIAIEGAKAKVTASGVKTPVQLKAKFTYNGEESVVRFTVNVFKQMDNMEKINYWYTNTGISQTLSGYVLGISTVYSDSYKNITLYMIDDSFQAGYYIYRGVCEPEVGAKIVPGVHITVTGSTNTCYSGLWETNEKTGTIVVDEDVEPINPLDTIVEFDNELTSKTPSYVYRQSQLVKINGWKIVEKLAVPASGATTNMLKVERDGAQIIIACSKYVESDFKVWEADADPKFAAVVEKYNSLNVGDYIDVVGYLSARDGDLINVKGAEYITVSSDKGETAGKEVAPVIAKVAFDKKYAEAKTIDLVASEGNVEVTWNVKENNVAKIENGKLVITPAGAESQFTLVGTFKKGDWSTDVYYVIKVGVIDTSIKTIAEAKALEKGSETIIQGKVMAINDKGYILFDGTDAAYVYVAGATEETEKVFTFKVGDTIKVEGVLDNYKGLVEYIPTKTTKVEINDVEDEVKYYSNEEIQAYVAATATSYAQDLVEFTGTLSVNGNYYNVIIEGLENEQVSLSNLTAAQKGMLEGLDGKEITFIGYAIGQSSNKYLNVMLVEVESALTIKGVINAPIDATVTFEGQVVAASSRGYVVYDGTGAIYVYAYGSKNSDIKDVYFYEEDFVRVKGVRGFYNGNQVIPTEADWLEEYPESLYNQGKAEVMTAEAMNAYVASSNSEFPTKLVELTGKVAISGSYYNFIVGEGETAGNGSFSYLTEEQKEEYVDGETYTVYGYVIGHSSNKYFNFIPCSYLAPLDPYQEVYKEGALYVNPAFTADNCTWGGQALTFGTNGFADIKEAINAAADGAEIYLQSGEYVLVDKEATDAITLDKALKFFGPNAGIPGTAKQRHPEATILIGKQDGNVTYTKKLEFDGVEIKGRGIGYMSNDGIYAGAGAEGITIKNCLINSFNSFLKVKDVATGIYTIESCKIHGMNQFFIWMTGSALYFVNNYFDGTDCGQTPNEAAALFRIRGVCDVKIYHNTFVGDTYETSTNPGWFEPNSTAGENGGFDIQYNNFNLVEKFFFKSAQSGLEEKAFMNNNIFTNGMNQASEYPTTIAAADINGITVDENTFETIEDLEAAWLTSGLTWKPVTYTVTFNADGGQPVEAIEFMDPAAVVLPTTTKEGFVFGGWYDGETLVTALTAKANVELKAKWLTAYTVTFEVAGGTAIDPIVFGDYTKVVLPNAVKEGSIFGGWYVGDEKYEALKENANITLTAKWVEQAVLTYNVNGGTAIDPVTFTDYTTVVLATPVYEGYVFAGWYNGDVLVTALTANESITLTAKWLTPETLTVPTEIAALDLTGIVMASVDATKAYFIGEKQVAAYTTIDAAWTAVEDNAVVYVFAGNYTISSTTTKSLKLYGPNAFTTERVEEAVVTPANNYALASKNFEIYGVELSTTEDNKSWFYPVAGVETIKINSCAIDCKASSISYGVNSFIREDNYTGTGMNIEISNCSINHMGQFLVNIGKNGSATTVNVVECTFTNAEQVGSQLFRIQAGAANCKINVTGCTFDGNLLDGVCAKAQAGVITFKYNTFKAVAEDSFFSTADGTVTFDSNLYLDVEGQTLATAPVTDENAFADAAALAAAYAASKQETPSQEPECDYQLTVAMCGFGSGETSYFNATAEVNYLYIADKATCKGQASTYAYANRVGISWNAEKECYVVDKIFTMVSESIVDTTSDYVIFWHDTYANKAEASKLAVGDEITASVDLATLTAGLVEVKLYCNHPEA